MNNLIFVTFLAIIFYLGYIVGILNPELLTIDATEIAKAQEICINANSKISKMESITVTCENGGKFRYYERKN